MRSFACGIACLLTTIALTSIYIEKGRASEMKNNKQWCQRIHRRSINSKNAVILLKAVAENSVGERKFLAFLAPSQTWTAFKRFKVFVFFSHIASILLYFDCWLHFRAHESFLFLCHWKLLMVFDGRKTPEIQTAPRHVALTIQKNY